MSLHDLQDTVREITSNLPVKFGIAIDFFETEETLYHNGEDRFQLASVVKVPILVTAIKAFERGEYSLEERIELKENHKTMPSGILTYLEEGLQPTFKDLLTLMIIISDNTATDMVLEMIGGPSAVNETMRNLGFGEDEMQIKMSIHELFDDIHGFSKPLHKRPEIIEEIKRNEVNLNGEVYGDNSTANVATPQAINKLYQMIYSWEAAGEKSCETILDILLLQTLNDRIPRDLHPETYVAHKTGTLTGIRDDAGIIYVSKGCHACLTVFTKITREITEEDFVIDRAEENQEIDQAIASLGEAVFQTGRELC